MVSRRDDERTPLLASQPKRSNGSMRPSSQQSEQDDFDFDARFHKWKAAVARKFRGKARREAKPSLLVTHFDGLGRAQSVLAAKRADALRQPLHEATSMTSAEFRQQVDQVKHAITKGVYPKMITTGSSGSYFVRVIADSSSFSQASDSDAPPPSQAALTTVAVFKPKDEEPYGNLNPKRQFARKYLWWAMGRPCLIPNFSYLSEVGASYLDSRLALQMVPRTELVELSSPTFHYAFNDRMANEKDGVPLPDKIGSYQTFLKGYVNASDFLRKHPWPSRTRSKTLLMRDMEDESRAHKVSRKKEHARLRNCGVAIKRALLCRPSWEDLYADDVAHASAAENGGQRSPSPVPGTASPPQPDGFYWTPNRMEQFRLQLERLVVLDFLMRNTDRGLDNFMIKHDPDKDEIKIGAIDNSLSFPIKHPNEIRQYPFGWLFLPSDLIGLPFSESTREHLLPILSDPAWWQHTAQGLRSIFHQDPYFDEAKFEKQMSVMRGQGWNLVQSLRAPDEGPLDLCAREKKLIRQEIQELSPDKLAKVDGIKVPLDPDGIVISPAEVVGKPSITRTTSSGVLETERRPIGMRASESYRKALLQAAGTETTLDADEELDDDQLVPDATSAVERGVSSSLPHTSTLKDKMREDITAQAAQPDSTSSKVAPKGGRHQRFASAHDVSTFSCRQRGAFQNNSNGAAEGPDSILGRTGIEVLEGLDRERHRQNKLNFFRPRPRSSTVSSDAAPSRLEDRKSRQNFQADGRTTGAGAATAEGGVERSFDLSSSIVSDPGYGSRWPRSKSVSRQGPGEGMVGSLYDLHSQGEVLSEEEEEEEEEDQEPSVAQLNRKTIPTIESVLQQSNSEEGKQNTDSNGNEGETSTAFTPHIPHPQSVPNTSDNGNDSKKTIKVIVEKLFSDTKQAWLKWI